MDIFKYYGCLSLIIVISGGRIGVLNASRMSVNTCRIEVGVRYARTQLNDRYLMICAYELHT